MYQRALQTLFVAATLLLTTTACDQGGDSKGAAKDDKKTAAGDDAKADTKKTDDGAAEAGKTVEPAGAEAGAEAGTPTPSGEGGEAAAPGDTEDEKELAGADEKEPAGADEKEPAGADEKEPAGDKAPAGEKAPTKESKSSSDDKAPPKDGGDVTASKVDAKEVYSAKCRSCHGADGKGDTTIGKKVDIPSLASTSLSKAKVVSIIENGVPDTKMKAYKGKLSKEEIDAVADYVKKL